jgi:arginyl-tRNA synthetase
MIYEAKLELEKTISKIIPKTDLENLIEIPPNRELGDFSLPCFKLAGKIKKPPQQIALELKDKIKLPKIFKKSEAKGPYLNFYLDEEKLAEKIIQKLFLKPEKPKQVKGKKIIVEYCQANPMKAFHIGHVRNICIGEAISRFFESQGKNVLRVDYGGDVGPHVSKTIYAYQNLQHPPEPKDLVEKEKWLGQLYSAGSKEVHEKPELEEKMRQMVVELEQGKNQQLKKDWEKLRKASMDCFQRIFQELGIKFDKIIMESDVEKEGIMIAKELEKKGIAKKDQGAILIDLEKYNLGKFLILKSDGAALYSSKDLALAKLKKKELKAEKSYNVVGSEQSFYFKQLIKTIELLNKIKNEYCPTEHISYEIVGLEGKKMSSREGNVITYSELFNIVFEKALFETKERHQDWNENKLRETAKKITLAAIKFGMLNHDRNKAIIFNWENAIKMEGETGPFIQYSYARAKSIIKKASNQNFSKKIILQNQAEKDLVYIISKYFSVLEESIKYLAPNKLANYLLELSKAFNTFYHESPVIQAEEELQKSRLAIISAFIIIMESGANILNLDLLEEM